MLRSLLLLSSLLFVAQLQSASHYIRAGATGAANGNSWGDAWTDLPATFVRGDIYYVADGTYGSHSFTTAASGTTTITIQKATPASHGSDTGWSDTYGDDVAVFTAAGNVFTFESSYWIIDGMTGTRNSGHGFSCETTGTSGSVYVVHLYSAGTPHNNTFRHVRFTCVDWCSAYALDAKQDLLRSAGNSGADNITLQYCFFDHPTINGIITSLCDNWLIEYCFFTATHSTAANHGQAIYIWNASNWTIRYSEFYNVSGSGVIFFKDAVSQVYNYGNIFWEDDSLGATGCSAWDTSTGHHSVGQLIDSNTGAYTLANIYSYNNTIIDIDGRGEGSPGMEIDAGSAVAMNNIWIGCYPGTTARVTFDYNAGSSATLAVDPHYQGNLTTAIFVNYAAANFHLSGATTAGTSLASPYNIDSDGVARGTDGTWDRGAYEYDGVGGVDATSPTITITAPSSSSTYSTTASSVVVSGTASDNVGVASVTGSADTTGSFSITGTTTWSGTVNLNVGANVITMTALDAAANSGADVITITRTVTDTTPPVISVISDTPTIDSATITWTTDEASTSGLEWGLTASYTDSATNATLATSHNLSASLLAASTLYHFRVVSTDAAGNTATSADGTFTTETVGGGGLQLRAGTSRVGSIRKP